MTDVTFDDEADEDDGEQDADERCDKDKDIAFASEREAFAKSHDGLAGEVDNGLQKYSRKTAENAHNHT